MIDRIDLSSPVNPSTDKKAAWDQPAILSEALPSIDLS
jgi:hypothetical protein